MHASTLRNSKIVSHAPYNIYVLQNKVYYYIFVVNGSLTDMHVFIMRFDCLKAFTFVTFASELTNHLESFDGMSYAWWNNC